MEVEIHAELQPRPDRPRKTFVMCRSTPLRSPGRWCRTPRLLSNQRSNQRSNRGLGLALTFILLAAVDAGATDSSPRKLGRGLANMTLGLIVFPAKVIETTRAQGPFVGLTWGLAKGVGWMVATEAIGVFEFLTCPFETPPDFKPILDPEFPWGHYRDADKRKAKQDVKRRKVFTRDR